LRTLESDSKESILAKVSRQLAAIEKRDWELWVIVVGTGILLAAGLIAITYPAALIRRGNIHIELDVSRELFLGLVAILVLFNTYVISRWIELRRAREAVISTSLQNELIRLQSFMDPLTEVYNRRSLDEMANKFISRARRLLKPLTFMVIDMDDFKEVNTRFGHLTGDFVLTEVAAMLRSVVRGSDAVVRFGGDEFLIILADTSADEGAEIVKARLAKSMEEWNSAGHLKDFTMTLSVGMANWSEGQTLDYVLHDADLRMYAAKQASKRTPSHSI
jgi:diguanylate cyclase (GGDEF)-like protein